VSTLRVAVVDDEPLAREGLVELLQAHAGIAVVGAWPDAPSALGALEAARVDALFVDVRMPGMDGFELVDALELDPMPAIVFVTAYDAHAIRAFDVSAIDYVLKPVSAERLAKAVERAWVHVRSRDDGQRARLATLLEGLLPARAHGVARLIVREVGQIVVVQVRDIDWIEGADYYARLHVGAKVHMLRETLASLEQRLDPRTFVRIHRSAIVNLARVRSVEAHVRGEGILTLADGTRLRVTRARRGELERRLSAE
jgi:two-component system LytT family response regulator